MNISKPHTWPGKRCRVANYRRGGTVEAGTVRTAEYCLHGNSASGDWRYVITLDRRTKAGRFLHLTVGVEAMRHL